MLSSVTWLFVTKILIQIYTLVVQVYIANVLSPKDYALIAISMLYINFIQLITDSGLGVAIIQKKELSKETLNSIFVISALTGILLYLISYCCSISVANFFRYESAVSMIRAISIIILFRSLTIVSFKLIEKKMMFKEKSIIDLVSKVISLTSTIVLVYKGYGVWGLVYGQVVYSLILSFSSFAIVPFLPSLKFLAYNETINIIKFGFYIVGVRFTWYARSNSEKAIGGRFLKTIEYGYYSFANQLVENLTNIILYIINVVSIPVLSKIQNDSKKIKENYLMIVKLSALLTIPLLTGAIIIGSEIFQVLFSTKWIPALFCFKALCIVNIARILAVSNENLFISVGKPKYSFIANIIMAILLIISLYIGVKYGLNGLISSIVFTYLLLNIFWTIFTLKYIGIKILSYLNNLKGSIISTIFMVVIVQSIKSFDLWQHYHSRINRISELILLIVSGATVYCLTFYYIEKKFLIKIFYKDRMINVI